MKTKSTLKQPPICPTNGGHLCQAHGGGLVHGQAHETKLICDALRMALWRRRMPKGVMVHSDRSSQYCSVLYQALFVKHGLACSMNGKGNCYDTACAESFFHTFKVAMIHGEALLTREAMRQAVFEYIEIDYNRTRRHSANGYISPLAFESRQSLTELSAVSG